MQKQRRAPAALRDVVVPTGWRYADHQAPDETGTPGGQPASLWPSGKGAHGGEDDGDGDGGGGGGTHPHHVVGSSHVEGAQVEGDDWSDEKGRDAAPDHQTTILSRENLLSVKEAENDFCTMCIIKTSGCGQRMFNLPLKLVTTGSWFHAHEDEKLFLLVTQFNWLKWQAWV